MQWIEEQWNELCLYVYLTYPHDLWQMKQNPNHCCLSCFWGYTLHIQPSLVIHTAWWEMFCPVKVRELLAQLEHWKSVCSPHTSQNPYNRGWPSTDCGPVVCQDHGGRSSPPGCMWCGCTVCSEFTTNLLSPHSSNCKQYQEYIISSWKKYFGALKVGNNCCASCWVFTCLSLKVALCSYLSFKKSYSPHSS